MYVCRYVCRNSGVPESQKESGTPSAGFTSDREPLDMVAGTHVRALRKYSM